MKNSLFAVALALAFGVVATAEEAAKTAAPAEVKTVASEQAPPAAEQAKAKTEEVNAKAEQAKAKIEKTEAKAEQKVEKTEAKAEITADVVAIDAEKKTITLKNASGEWTLPAEGAALESLKTLKAGDKVVATIRHDEKAAPAAIVAVKAAAEIKSEAK